MVLNERGALLRPANLPEPSPGVGQVLVRVHACAVCRTDLHIVDGELRGSKLPLILGHQIVGTVVDRGPRVERPAVGERVGIPWLARTCGRCRACTSGRENLCNEAAFTGYHVDGGLAELCVADAASCFALPEDYTDDEAAPLLCAGAIGHRALRMAGDAERIGVYGFGAAARLLVQVARHEGRKVYAFSRPGKVMTQALARELGAVWAGGSDEAPPDELDAAILFAPEGRLVPTALRQVARGGTVVCAEIHMSDIPAFPYELLWGERVLRSVANLTRRDAEEFLALAPTIPIRTEVVRFPLEAANEAIAAHRKGNLRGAVVVDPRTPPRP